MGTISVDVDSRTPPGHLGATDAAEHGNTTVAELRDSLLHIIATRAFRPVYQPIVDLRSGEEVGYEALTRFDDDHRPDRVFGLARRVGLLAALDEATASVALAAAADLPPGWISVNLAASTLTTSSALRGPIAAVGRPVVVELTEHEPLDDDRTVRRAVAGLGADVRLAVDDLGAGFAGLRHLLDLRPDMAKLDRSLVDGLPDDPTRQALVAGIAAAMHTLGGMLVAEGVEHDDQVACLRALDVDLGQGFAFARPQPAGIIADRLAA